MICFACDRPIIGKVKHKAITSDGAQIVPIGSECFKEIVQGGILGWQPPKGGPRLFIVQEKKLTHDHV
jgi:hypothetical protein